MATTTRDNGELIKNIRLYHADDTEPIPVEVTLPDYLDITSLLALQRRMFEVVRLTGKSLRLVSSTRSLEVEKYFTRLFADRDDIFTTVRWERDD